MSLRSTFNDLLSKHSLPHLVNNNQNRQQPTSRKFPTDALLYGLCRILGERIGLWQLNYSTEGCSFSNLANGIRNMIDIPGFCISRRAYDRAVSRSLCEPLLRSVAECEEYLQGLYTDGQSIV